MLRRVGNYFQKDPDFHVKELQETATLLVNMGYQLGTANESLLKTQLVLKNKESDLQALVNSIDDVILEIDGKGVFENVWTSDPGVLAKPINKGYGNSIMFNPGCGHNNPFP